MTNETEKDLRTAVLTLRRAMENLLALDADLSSPDYIMERREAEQAIEYASDVLDPTLSR